MSQTVIHESQLVKFASCALFTSTRDNDLEAAARATFRWALRRRHEGFIPAPHEIRPVFMNAWNNQWGEQNRNGLYWEGPKDAAGTARRIYEFLLKYEVVHPYEPYELDLDGIKLIGENAVVSWDKAKVGRVPMVVGSYLRRPRDIQLPNYTVLAQWLSARQDIEDVDLGIVHMPLAWGDRWTTNDVNEALARKWLSAMVRTSAEDLLFPRVGTYCVDCTHPCKEVFRGSDDHYRG